MSSNESIELPYMPMPASLSGYWNFGSLLGMCLGLQIVSGLFLAMQYTSFWGLAFESTLRIGVEVNWGWWLRGIHANGASLFFAVGYLHIGRGVYYGSYLSRSLWTSGIVLIVLLMGTAFLGYVLPWGQMSLWGATVITNLISVIPYVGGDLVIWVWGGYSVGGGTLCRFFGLHFLLPFVIVGLVVGHIILLHSMGSSNPVGVVSYVDGIPFFPYFGVKDVVGIVVVLVWLGSVCCVNPWVFGDAENFIESNSMVTPIHIKPEWYFLFAYAILRGVPNKLGGVIGLGGSIVAVWVLCLGSGVPVCYCGWKKYVFWVWVSCFCGLSWVGGKTIEEPYMTIAQVGSVVYFISVGVIGLM